MTGHPGTKRHVPGPSRLVRLGTVRRPRQGLRATGNGLARPAPALPLIYYVGSCGSRWCWFLGRSSPSLAAPSPGTQCDRPGALSRRCWHQARGAQSFGRTAKILRRRLREETGQPADTRPGEVGGNALQHLADENIKTTVAASSVDLTTVTPTATIVISVSLRKGVPHRAAKAGRRATDIGPTVIVEGKAKGSVAGASCHNA